jgi:hypothetical protein
VTKIVTEYQFVTHILYSQDENELSIVSVLRFQVINYIKRKKKVETRHETTKHLSLFTCFL